MLGAYGAVVCENTMMESNLTFRPSSSIYTGFTQVRAEGVEPPSADFRPWQKQRTGKNERTKSKSLKTKFIKDLTVRVLDSLQHRQKGSQVID